jgi:hypothetical protein
MEGSWSVTIQILCSTRVCASPLVVSENHPTDQQFEAVEHTVPSKEFTGDEVTSCVGAIDHAEPFHRSARLCAPVSLGSVASPTAQQSAELTHVTPKSRFSSPTLVSGVGTIDQAVPSQCSARVCTSSLLDPPRPTAQQSDEVAQVTPDNTLVCDKLVLGEATMFHVLPSQCSAKV